MYSNEDAALCPVCHGVYDDPRTLPCGHSICLKCIARVAGLGRNDFCPSCRKDVSRQDQGVKGLLKNYSLDYSIEGPRKMSSALCSEHKRSLDMFCEQCDVLICSKCVFRSHSWHPIQKMDHIFNKRKQRLTELLESTKPWQTEIKEKTDEIRSSRQSVKRAAEAIKAKLDDAFKRWSDDLEKQRQTLQRYVDNETERRLKVFDDRLTVLNSAYTDINNLQTEMNTTLSKDTTSVVQLCRSMEESHKTVGMKAKIVMESPFILPQKDLETDISAHWMEEAIQNIESVDIEEGEIISVARGVSILEENETFQRAFQRQKVETDMYKSLLDLTDWRARKASDELKVERRKNKELIDKLEKEKRGQELRNAELGKHVDKLRETIKQKAVHQFQLFKKRLERKETSLLRWNTYSSGITSWYQGYTSGGIHDYRRNDIEEDKDVSRNTESGETILVSKSSARAQVLYKR